MPFYGADLEQLRQTATQFASGANSLESAVKTLSNVVNNGAAWVGPDANRFRSQWSGQSLPDVNRAVAALRRAAEELRRNADEQDQASAVRRGPAAATAGGAVFTAAPSAGSTPGSGHSTTDSPKTTSAAKSKNAHAVDSFVGKWQHKEINYDKRFGAQCFDVFRQYNTELGIPNGPLDDHASNIYQQYNSNGLSKYYDRIAYGSGTPQPGDVIVYGGNRYNGGYGHVAVVTSVDGDQYSVIEQNYTGKVGPDGWPHDPALVRSHTFSNKADGPILGFLRPKG